ncbi:hypothetical protein BFL38_12065 [Brachyspira hampsonii]|uniref:Uncharacterized protein n=1 Tax=Brachyspira hampsonii TaxID=1287055 RepID=A0A1E5NJ30_9SPIR|nr:hypothetical protein [Brachyspira hampsonii]OEJ16168.1 hypothetical protein BFL38_12065 [Brachyspira hampsonii]
MKKAVIKIILCLTAVIFAVSCGGNNDSPTNPTQWEFSVNIVDSYGTIEEKTIGTSSENTSLIKEGKIRCYTEQETKVEISKVTAASGGVSLEPADFELTTSTVSSTANEIGITLSASGIEKVKTAAAGEVYQYTFTFLFTRTSDNKTVSDDGKLYVANIDIIKQTDIEIAMQNVDNGSAGKVNLVVSETPTWEFSLSGFTLNKTSGFTATATSSSGSVYVSSAESAITLQTKPTGFFFTTEGKKDTEKQATFTIKVNINNGYMLDDAVSYAATDGFKLILSLGQTSGTWNQL